MFLYPRQPEETGCLNLRLLLVSEEYWQVQGRHLQTRLCCQLSRRVQIKIH